MRRVIAVVAGVLVLSGVVLAVVGHSHDTSVSRTPTTDVPPRISTTASTGMLPEGTWTFGSGPSGYVQGKMHITGGPKPGHDQPLAGMVEVHHPGDPQVLTRFSVDRTGVFRTDLPPGDYLLVARPSLAGIESFRSQEFAINGGGTSHVDLVDIAT